MQEIINFLLEQKKFHKPDVIAQVFEFLKLKIDANKVILVAGTNGKGTVCATLQTLLRATGKNVGMFTSPHLVKINERIRYNCADISNADFCEIFSAIYPKIAQFELSYFEYLTVMAVYYFFSVKKVDYTIFEVGLGGTLDSTNAVPHNISVITKLGLDHEDILGAGIKNIAKNKFGIIRNNNSVFHEKFDDEINELVRRVAQEKNANLISSDGYELIVEPGPNFFIKMYEQTYPINLVGERAAENIALAVTIFKNIIGEKDFEKYLPALKRVKWPGRMQKILYGWREIFLSGDHNPQGIQSLIELLKYYEYEKIHFVVGICRDKDHNTMLEKLMAVQNSFLYLTETPEKTRNFDDYGEKWRKIATFNSSDSIVALNYAVSHAYNKDMIVVTGSLYLIGKVLSYLHLQRTY